MRTRVARSLRRRAAICTPRSRSRATGSALWVSVESGDSPGLPPHCRPSARRAADRSRFPLPQP
eukprot:6436262-Prymnesium_polylepis.1